MTARSTALAAAGASPLDASFGGLRLAFTVAAGLALLTVVVALALPGGPTPAGDGGHAESRT